MATPAAASSTSPNADPFPFPRDYHFPAFYTRQTNLVTRHSQYAKWSQIILSYCRHHRRFKLSLSSAAESDLFFNRQLNRRLLHEDVKDVISWMEKEGRAEYVKPVSGGGSAGAGGGGGGATTDVVIVWWKTVDEWANTVEKYVEETGQKSSVLTVYELTEGDGTRGTEIWGMDKDVLMKALNVIVKKGRAQIFGSEDSPGIKFF